MTERLTSSSNEAFLPINDTVVVYDRTAFIKEHVDAMIEARKVANKIESEREKAIAYHDNIVPMMEEIRYHIDKLELIVDNQMWTLPKYRELLFIR